jgi:prepilin-type N-terminal cleavage/methylation domain-containing protein
MRNILKITTRESPGFTLVELLVVLAIMAIIGTGIGATVNQVIDMNSAAVNHMQAIKQVENAIYYLNRDVPMAQTITTNSIPGELLTMTYREWGKEPTPTICPLHTITYSIVTPLDGSPKYLERRETIDPGQMTAKNTIVANFIDDASGQTNCSYDSNLKQLLITLTSTVDGYKPATETRILKIRLRPVQQ